VEFILALATFPYEFKKITEKTYTYRQIKPSRLLINWEKDLCYKSKPYLIRKELKTSTSLLRRRLKEDLLVLYMTKIYQATEICVFFFMRQAMIKIIGERSYNRPRLNKTMVYKP
jgi:hypothetical protein